MLSSLSLFDDFFDRRPSVYVVSDSQLAAWKHEKAQAEIIELEKRLREEEKARRAAVAALPALYTSERWMCVSTGQESVIPVLAFAAFTVSTGEDECTSDERHDDHAADEAPGPRWNAG